MQEVNETQEQNRVGLTVQREARRTNDLLGFSDSELLEAEVDDGAALRLAAKLMLDRVTFHPAAVEVYKFPTPENTLVNIIERYDGNEYDKCKAARKAIVLAAAQICRART